MQHLVKGPVHSNNFDFLRLCFAFFVLITHSYVLAGSDNDFLANWTLGQVNFSSIGLKGFFIISGYLIFESMVRSKTWLDYMLKRILRIYPALIVVLIFSFFLVYFVGNQSFGEYIQNKTALSYIYTNLNLFTPLQYNIGETFPDNPLPNAINGSLWTIPYEFLFYIILSLAMIISRFRKLLIVALALTVAGIVYMKIKFMHREDYWLPPFAYELKTLLDFAHLFAIGSFLAAIKLGDFKYKKVVAWVSLAAIVVTIYLQQYTYTQYYLLPLLVISFGSLSTKGIAGINKTMGDFSYGMYLYGFPVQQTLMHYFKLSPLALLAASASITFVLAALSWYLVEKRALALKRFIPAFSFKKLPFLQRQKVNQQ